jgi:hypothetical protein
MAPATVGKTTDRSVLGTMVDFVHMTYHILPEHGWGQSDLLALEAKLAASPRRVTRPARGGFFPDQKTTELLEARGQGGRTGFDFT